MEHGTSNLEPRTPPQAAKPRLRRLGLLLLFSLLMFPVDFAMSAVQSQKNTGQAGFAPSDPVKLIFIHHSVGGHWLAHDTGGLVSELNRNNYYVNDVTYGWEPPSLTDTFWKKVKRKAIEKLGKGNRGAYDIGNRTDIGDMPDWFVGNESSLIMSAVFRENLETDNFGEHRNTTSSYPLENPGPSVENQIVMFKSCYPNTLFKGRVTDPPAADGEPVRNFPAGAEEHTVANAKRVFNDLLPYFASRPDKFFVIVTPPPRTELPEDGEISRGFCNWLVFDWLRESKYELSNVFVFDLYNVLTSGYDWKKSDVGEESGNHHRIWDGKVQHVIGQDNHLLMYPRDGNNNNHPSPVGLQKATSEFVPLLNHYYGLWSRFRSGNQP